MIGHIYSMSSNTNIKFRYQFGRRRLSIKTLNRNKLVLYDQGAGRTTLIAEIISDDLKAVIKAIIKGDILKAEEAVEMLDDIDRKLLFKALDDAQIDTEWDRPSDTAKTALIHRFTVLKDEIMLGNSGSDTLKEFGGIIDACFAKKLLNRPDYQRMKDLIIQNV